MFVYRNKTNVRYAYRTHSSDTEYCNKHVLTN